ncbi:uncharacterized protein LOC134216363 [Armigeres subalbatus]|uniref:uncharacterized protein LOC134216363 n=1 Tax=Armigeres subalbatus TaxID=124917 RepID=UPI002ED5AC7F
MDQISLTDLRRQFFGPTLDESLLYGVECLRDFFSWRQHFDTDPTYSQTSRERSDSVVSDFNLYQSCRDLNELAHSESAISKKQNRYRRKLSNSNEQKGKPSILNIKSERKSSLSSDQVRPKRKVSTSECHCWADENAIAKTSPSSKQLQDYQVLSSEEMKEQKRSSLSSNTEEFESALSAKSKSCEESSKEENVSKNKNAINSSPSLKEPSKLSRTDKLFSSSEQSSKTKPSSNGSSKILEKLKKSWPTVLSTRQNQSFNATDTWTPHPQIVAPLPAAVPVVTACEKLLERPAAQTDTIQMGLRQSERVRRWRKNVRRSPDGPTSGGRAAAEG